MQIPRVILFLFGLFLLMLGVTLCWGYLSPWITSFAFGSMFIAASIAVLWIAITESYKVLVGAGLCSLVAFGASGIVLLRQGIFYGEIALIFALGSLWYFFLGLKVRAKPIDKLPLSVQGLFGIVLSVFLLEGVYLITPVTTHFPWLLEPHAAQTFGWLLIGSTIFLGWALLHPTWENGYPQLYALLAFDLLMVGPLFALLGEGEGVIVMPGFLTGALIFVTVTALWAIIDLCRRLVSNRIGR